MLDSLTTANHTDFKARYKGTWGYYLPESGKKILVKVHDVDSKEAKFVDIDGGVYSAFANKGLMFEFIPVNKGFFNGDKHVYWFERVPARQWQRGISPNNTKVHIFNGLFTPAKLEQAIDVVFNPHKPCLGVYESWRFYRDGHRPSVALSKHFALSKENVFFYTQKIGTITQEAITLFDDTVVQELKDVIRRTGIQLDVRV